MGPNATVQPVARPASEEDVRQLVRSWFHKSERQVIDRELMDGPTDDLAKQIYGIA